MEKPTVTIGVILFTGCEKYLPHSLKSLLSQDYPNLEVLLRDQSPNHEVYTWMQEHLPEVFTKATVQKAENRMHSGGHNDLIAQKKGSIYIVASNDMWYPPDFVTQAVAELQKPENAAGTLSPKLMQWDFKKVEMSDFNNSLTPIIDSCGIGIKPTHHFYDIGQGQEDRSQFDTQTNVFGASGALTILTQKAIDAVKNGTEIYDELLHYKNDCDLAYRLQWAGIPCRLVPTLKVWHDRQVSGNEGMIESRKGKSKWVKENSLLGHLILLQKNFDERYTFKTRLKTKAYELAKKLFILIREPYLLATYKKVKTLKPHIDQKRKAMKKVATPAMIEAFMR